MTTLLNQSANSEHQDELKRLRELVLGDEYHDAIQQVVDKGFSRNVADVVSEAIEIRNQHDDTIGQALAPVVDTALKESIEKNPQSIVNVIFPIIGPSIRKAVSSAIVDLLLSINELIERSVGMRSVKWRIDAWREGTPYAKYVLLKNLKYRVDQIFLIEKSTGILMASISNRFYQDADSDLVSSMLTAINDFVVDSFNADESESLERIRFGDRVIQINVGQKVILALAVTGMVSHELKDKAIDTLEAIENQYASSIDAFNGDSESMQILLPTLESCLVEKKIEKEKSTSKPWIAYVLVVALFSWLAFSGYQTWEKEQKINQAIEIVGQQDTMALLSYDEIGNVITFNVIQDPSSMSVLPKLKNIFGEDVEVKVSSTFANLDQQDVWLNYLNNHYQFSEKPSLEFLSKTIFIKGDIYQDDLQRLRRDPLVAAMFTDINASLAKVLKPLTQEDLRNLEINKLKNKINATQLFFETSENQLNSQEQAKLRVLAEDILELQNMAAGDLSILGQILILGFADSIGTSQRNIDLSKERAGYVANYFKAQGVSEDLIVEHPMGHVDIENLKPEQQRRVTVSVISSRTVQQKEVNQEDTQ